LEEFEQVNAVKRKMAQKGWIKRESNEQQYSHKLQGTYLRRLKAAANKTRQDWSEGAQPQPKRRACGAGPLTRSFPVQFKDFLA
jgi:hypothetical protein